MQPAGARAIDPNVINPSTVDPTTTDHPVSAPTAPASIPELTAEEKEQAKAKAEIHAQGATPGGVVVMPKVIPAPTVTKSTQHPLKQLEKEKLLFMKQNFPDPNLASTLEIAAKDPAEFEKRRVSVDDFEKNAPSKEVALLICHAHFMLDFMPNYINDRFESNKAVQETSDVKRLIVLKSVLLSKMAETLKDLEQKFPDAIVCLEKLHKANILVSNILLDRFVEKKMLSIPAQVLYDYQTELKKGNFTSKEPELHEIVSLLQSVSEEHRQQFIDKIVEAIAKVNEKKIERVYAGTIPKVLLNQNPPQPLDQNPLRLFNPEFINGIQGQLEHPEGKEAVKGNILLAEKAFTENQLAVYRFIVQSGTIMARNVGVTGPEEMVSFAIKRVLTLPDNTLVKEACAKIIEIEPEYLKRLKFAESKQEIDEAVKKQAEFVQKLESVDSIILKQLRGVLEGTAEQREIFLTEFKNQVPVASDLFSYLTALPEKLRSSIIKAVIAGINDTLQQKGIKLSLTG